MTEPSNLIITNTRVLTMDRLRPRAEAVAVEGNRIVFVGTNEGARERKKPGSRAIDGRGGTLMPGIIDSHIHILGGSLQLGSAALGEVGSLPELADNLRAFADANPRDVWVTGARIGYDILPGGERLSRHHLDAMISDRPVILVSYDFHTAWANTRGLELAGLLLGADLGAAGEVVMGQDGLADGELREMAAYGPVLNMTDIYGGLWALAGSATQSAGTPALSDRTRTLIHTGLMQAARFGITSVHNMDGDPAQVALFAGMEERGELPLRIHFPCNLTPDSPPGILEEALEMRARYQGDKVRCGSIKTLLDGVIESWTGWMLEDYANKPGERGRPMWDFEVLSEQVLRFDREGFQIIIHAIGDRAIREALNALELARQKNGIRDSRHRIEHIELLHPDDLPRFSSLGVIASMQPLHIPSREIWPALVWPECIPQERWKDAFPWQQIRESGATLVFGSDWPVASQDPWRGLQFARNRQALAEGLPDQRQSLEDALAAYTRDAAFAEFKEQEKGQLKEGLLADMVLLSADLESMQPAEVGRVHPLMTVCDGQITHEA